MCCVFVGFDQVDGAVVVAKEREKAEEMVVANGCSFI